MGTGTSEPLLGEERYASDPSIVIYSDDESFVLNQMAVVNLHD